MDIAELIKNNSTKLKIAMKAFYKHTINDGLVFENLL